MQQNNHCAGYTRIADISADYSTMVNYATYEAYIFFVDFDNRQL